MSGMDELVAWLRWQIDRDEEFARVAPKMAANRREQLLGEVQAKRRIVDEYARFAAYDEDEWEWINGKANALGFAVRCLASMYAHCEGYRDEWRPTT